MQRKSVRVSNAVLDLESCRVEQGKLLGDAKSQNTGAAIYGRQAPTSPEVVKALNKYIASGTFNLSVDDESLELREKLSQYTSLPVEMISCFGGADIALEHIARTFLEPGTEAVMACAPDNEFRLIAQSTGARISDICQSNPFEPQIENIIDQIGPRTRLVYVSNPDNLSGASYTEPEIVFLLAYAERAMVVVDESYFEFSGRTMASLLRRFPNLIIVRDFTKAFGLASLQLGYILSDPENLEFVQRLKITRSLTELCKVAAISALSDQEFTRDYISQINQSRKMLSQNLPETGYEFKMTGADFFLVKVADSEDAAERLKSEGLLARDLSAFPSMINYLQIPIGTPENTDRLLLSLSRQAREFSTGMNRIRSTPIFERTSSRVEVGVGIR